MLLGELGVVEGPAPGVALSPAADLDGDPLQEPVGIDTTSPGFPFDLACSHVLVLARSPPPSPRAVNWSAGSTFIARTTRTTLCVPTDVVGDERVRATAARSLP